LLGTGLKKQVWISIYVKVFHGHLVMQVKRDPREYDVCPSLVFGLVGPLGTDLDLLAEVLSEELSKVGYETKIIHVSQLIRSIPHFSKIDCEQEDKRIENLMSAGTEIRETSKRGDVLAY
jgi:hypothetical protein